MHGRNLSTLPPHTVAAITALRQTWPEAEIDERVRAAAEHLNEQTPSSPYFHLYNPQEQHCWAWSESVAWVRTDAVVNAVDPVWGDFDRMEKSRGPIWIPRATRELLTTPTDNLAAFLRHHLAEEPEIALGVINGPAGSLYNISSGGAHRTHLFKILGLPRLFARLHARIVPRTFDVAKVIDTSKGMDEVKRVGHGWHTLRERGLIQGKIRYTGDFATFHVDHSPAPWLLGDDTLASAYLSELGIPPEALTGRKAWSSWLYG